MSRISASSASPIWRSTDGLLAVLLSVVLPTVLLFSLYIAALIGLVPNIWTSFLTQDSSAILVGQYLLALSIEGVVILGLVRYRKARLSDLGIKKFDWRWIGYVILLYILLLAIVFVANALVKALWPVVDLDQVQDVYTFGRAGWAVGLSLFTSVVVAPVVEETLFRGLLFGSLMSRLSPVWSAVISSGIFAILHGQLNVMIYTFLLGLILCWLYRRSGSIVPGIVLHLLNNTIAFWAITSIR